MALNQRIDGHRSDGEFVRENLFAVQDEVELVELFSWICVNPTRPPSRVTSFSMPTSEPGEPIALVAPPLLARITSQRRKAPRNSFATSICRAVGLPRSD